MYIYEHLMFWFFPRLLCLKFRETPTSLTVSFGNIVQNKCVLSAIKCVSVHTHTYMHTYTQTFTHVDMCTNQFLYIFILECM